MLAGVGAELPAIGRASALRSESADYLRTLDLCLLQQDFLLGPSYPAQSQLGAHKKHCVAHLADGRSWSGLRTPREAGRRC